MANEVVEKGENEKDVSGGKSKIEKNHLHHLQSPFGLHFPNPHLFSCCSVILISQIGLRLKMDMKGFSQNETTRWKQSQDTPCVKT